jgi:hypothetical protein
MSSAPNMCMDVSGVAKSNGTKVHSWSCNNAANQSWSYQPGTGQLTDANSGKCLDLPGGNDATGLSYRSAVNGTNNNQKWEVMDGVLRKPVPTSVEVMAAQRPTAPRSSCGIVTWGEPKWLMGSAGPNPQGPGSRNKSDWGVAEVLSLQATCAVQIQAVGRTCGKSMACRDPLKRGRDRAEQTGEWLGTY